MFSDSSSATDLDVLVAGAGAAGLSAALAAAQQGLDVMLIDANASFREACSTVMSTAMIPAGGSRWQTQAAIDDSPDQFLADVMAKTGGAANPAVAKRLTTIAPELVAWLADACDVPLQLVTDFQYPGHSRFRCHTVADRAGRTLHQHLLRAADDQDGLILVAPRRLTDVTLTDGRVSGAALATPDGTTELLRTPCVILATAGFAGNERLVSRHIPEIAGSLYFGGDGSDGDALALAERLGADVDCLDAYQGHGSVATPHGVLLTWATVMHGGILVNSAGRRFGDESSGYSEYARLVISQPDATAWLIYDHRIDLACQSFADYQQCLSAGAVRRADTLEALAGLIDVPLEALSETLAGTGPGDAFGRTDWEAPLAPPYAAVRVTGALFHTQGGLSVDEHAAVLREGMPIPGLYAAGGAAVGMSGHGAAGYLAGNGLLAALGLGYTAGVHAGTTRRQLA